MGKHGYLKTLGFVLMLTMTGILAYSFYGPSRKIFLPGPTTNGHYQIELACDSCHERAFGDREALQEACLRCHREELKEAADSHPEAKFTDPRNADRVAQLDARFCVTCHREHRPELVSAMGLSLPEDYCFRCHESIAEDRSSHAGLGFETCANPGCHNFHDNRALYEDFVEAHLDEPDLSSSGKNPARARREPRSALTLANSDAPPAVRLAEADRFAWAGSGHARGGVNCMGCHASQNGHGDFQREVSGERCGSCHERERAGYLKGRHGMRQAAGLGPMRVGDARQPMKPSAEDRELGCTSCHRDHAFDTRAAAVEACLGCHADEHSTSYSGSRHAELWRRDETGRSGASCATCHLPRIDEGASVHVEHNQNDVLRPNEKMARTVCIDCHGLSFTLSALADDELIRSNFRGRPARAVRSFEMVRARLAAH